MVKMSASSTTTGASAAPANVSSATATIINNSRNNRVIVPNHDNNNHHQQLQSIIDRLADVYRSDSKKMCYDEDDEDHGICDSLEILDDDEDVDVDDLNCDIKISENSIMKSDRNLAKSNLNEKDDEGDEFDTNFDDNTSDLTSSPPPPVSPSKSSSPCHSSLNPIVETIAKTITFSSSSTTSSNDTCSAISISSSSLQSSYTSASVASIASLSSSSSTTTTTNTTTTEAIRIEPPNMLSTMIQHFGGINNKHSSSSSPTTTTTPPRSPQSSLHPLLSNSSEQTLTSNSLPQSSSQQPIIPVPPPFPSCFHNDLISDTDGPTHHHQLMYQPSVSSIRDAVSHLTRLDDFNVVKLSQGFFSQVFKVIHFSTKKTMVLKMNKEVGNRGNALKEIELLNKLNHPNIVAYMGTVVHEGALHPLLEYINGGTLEQLIKQFYTNESLHLMDGSSSSPSTSSSSSLDQPLSLNSLSEPIPQFTAANIPIRNGIVSPKIHLLQNSDRTFTKLMRDVARGMDYLHSSGYLHRDLASKNVFIRKLPVRARSRDLNNNNNSNNQRIQKEDPTRSERNCQIDAYLEDYFDDDRMVAVIGDFGFATTEPSPDQKLSTVGSPYWLAPECFKNQWYNHKCDIYSFGVMCCELNWCVPADPDYLPRMSHNFVVDFDQLHTRKDTLLASVAQLSCQIDPNHRPEFSELIRLFDSKLNEFDQYDYIDDDGDHEQDIGSRGLDQPPQLQPQAAYNRSQFVFRRGNSLDSSLYSGWFNNKAHGDVFEQHLLRRRLSAVYNRCSSIYNHHNHHNHLEPRRLNHSKSSNCS